jgi:Nucleotide modification associated domain 3
MKALLVRVGADQSEGGGFWNGLVDSQTNKFVYVPIPESSLTHPQFDKPYSIITPALEYFNCSLPAHLTEDKMHLDPDFLHLTYGDQGQRAIQISAKLQSNDLLVFYAGLRDIHPRPRLVCALIGLYVIDHIEKQ